MSEYNKFLENVYSDELITVDPDEFDEVNRLMAEEGYHEFSLGCVDVKKLNYSTE